MAQHRVCPWWIGYLAASPIRKWRQNPTRIHAPYVRADMWVLEPGPDMGFFHDPDRPARGPCGRVVAVDVGRPGALDIYLAK
jgi:hypothetical protein